MMNRNKINELLRRYDEALTTDAEERELAEFFRSATDIPDEWADYAVLFKAMDSTDSLFSDEELAVAPKKARIVAPKRWLWAAAVAALVVAGAGLIRLNQLTKENAELIAENEPKAVEIHQNTASEGSIFAQKIAQKPNDSISTQKATAKVEKEIEEKGDEKKEIIEVSGNVFSLTDKEPVVGATVIVVGTKIGAATDVNDNFSLRCQKGSLLKIFFVGMYPTVVEAQPSLNIALAPDDSALDEIIVVGYGKQKKSEKTGSIRLRGTSSPTTDHEGILVLINGEECSETFDWIDGTIDDLKEFLKKRNLIYEDLSILKADAVAEKYRQKFGDWVKIVIEITAHPIDQEGEIYEVAAQMPQFPGGEEALMEFVEKNLQCPQDVIRRGVHGQVVVSFIVGKNGKIQHPEAGKVFLKKKSGAPCSSPMIELLCRNEAVRIVKMMQNWNPGKNEKGEAVRVLLHIPIKFNE